MDQKREERISKMNELMKEREISATGHLKKWPKCSFIKTEQNHHSSNSLHDNNISCSYYNMHVLRTTYCRMATTK